MPVDRPEAITEAPGPLARLIGQRRSCRAFLDRPVDPGLLAQWAMVAARAASGGNLQPWHVDVLTGSTLSRLYDAVGARLSEGVMEAAEYAIYPEGLGAPYAARRADIGERLYAALGIERSDRAARHAQFARNFRGFGAPAMLFLTVDRTMGPPQWSDLGGFLAQFLLLVEEAGLASCAQECWALYPEIVRSILGTPAARMLFCGVAVGWADPADPVNIWPTPRAAADDWLRLHG